MATEYATSKFRKKSTSCNTESIYGVFATDNNADTDFSVFLEKSFYYLCKYKEACINKKYARGDGYVYSSRSFVANILYNTSDRIKQQ